jgi:hypothetical protein
VLVIRNGKRRPWHSGTVLVPGDTAATEFPVRAREGHA